MHYGNVIAFEIIVDVDLPVAVNVPVFAGRELHRREIAVADRRRQVLERFGQRRAVRIEIHKHQRSPRLDSKLRQAVRFLAEALDSVKLRRAEQTSIKRIAPTVVTALKDSARAASCRNRTGAMPTDVRKCAQLFIFASYNEYGFIRDQSGEVVPGPRDLLGSPDKLPCAAKHFLLLNFEYLSVGIPTRRQGRRSRQALFE